MRVFGYPEALSLHLQGEAQEWYELGKIIDCVKIRLFA
jgi:hypothetical protein|tara:strand:+ start:33 stop:146 length:114 start_codon:yes stop_codon:yes gene_type:complete